MDMVAWWTATQFTAVAAWATVVIYVALGIFGLIQVLQARTLRLEQARPFVVVDFGLVDLLFFLTIENVGRTMARNVVVTFDKPLEPSLERPRQLDDALLFREPIPAMAPGKKLRVPFDTIPRRRERGLPLAYEVTLRYEGPTGRKYGKGEGYRLDMSLYEVVAAGEKGMTQLVEQVEKLHKEFAKWTDGGRGLRVHNVDREKQKRTEIHEWLVQRSVESAKAEGIVPAARTFVRDVWRRALSRRGLG